MADGQLLERYATGHGDAAEVAFAVLVERHGPMVLRTCRGVLRDDHEAMDAYQATFLILVRKGRSLWVRDSLGPWLHRVATRVAGQARAKKIRSLSLARRLAETAPRAPEGSEELIRVVHEELDRLPDRYRLPIILCDLEGQTCAEAARHLGCPIGTIGSRLARGRERLRGRLVRRGLTPALGAMTAAFAREAVASPLTVGQGVGAMSPAIVGLVKMFFQEALMSKLGSFAAAAICGIGLLAGWGLSGTPAQTPAAAAVGKTNPRPETFPFVSEERMRDYTHATIGRLPSLLDDRGDAHFTDREAVSYKDGTAKLWNQEQKDPIAVLRNQGPIHDLAFFNESGLLVTASDEGVRVWDGRHGKLLKDLPGQAIRPLRDSISQGGGRFLTFDLRDGAVSVWDTARLERVAHFRPAATASAAGLSDDGRIAATFHLGEDFSVELWDVTSGQMFATLRPPSPSVASIRNQDGREVDERKVDHGTRFWELARSLAPESPTRKD